MVNLIISKFFVYNRDYCQSIFLPIYLPSHNRIVQLGYIFVKKLLLVLVI